MDPLSITASIIGVLTFTIQVGTAIDTFISEYRAADSELKAIVGEVDALRGVLQSLHNAYRKPPGGIPEQFSGLWSNKWKKLARAGHERSNPKGLGQTDNALESTLEGLGGSLEKLADVVTTSKHRMGKGGVHKVYVQALWQRTATGIEKVPTVSMDHVPHL